MRKYLTSLMLLCTVACSPDMHAVKDFILANWDGSIRTNTADEGTLIGLPHPYSVPCVSGAFQEMYYWDTFFTNEGLILSGRCEQARNNTENVAYLIERYGFMPNGTRTWYLNRSQPPYFAMMVKAVYDATPDEAFLKEMYPVIEKEYAFWMQKRSTPCGLNRYSSEADAQLVEEFLATGSKRIGADFDAEGLDEAQKYTMGRNFAAEAESGWDFNPRFERRCEDFCPVDLNANLYFYETFLASLASRFGGDSQAWEQAAARRKAAMESLMKDDKGCYHDYDHVNGTQSSVVSGAVFNLMAFEVLDAEGAEALVSCVLPLLETRHGIAATAPGNWTYSYQWAWPNSWPPVQYMAERGLMAYGYERHAKRIAGKYTRMVAEAFEATGNLWEKYNLLTGKVVDGVEYETPAMLGWTAGTFLYSYELIEKK